MRVALLDANVLHPISLTDLLLRLAEVGAFEPRWSADIHEEWIRSVVRSDPAQSVDRLRRRRDQMDAAFPTALVRGYDPCDPALVLPDPGDRHVLAAAIAGRVQTLVTFNQRDFPPAVIGPHRLELAHPDPFLADLILQSEETGGVAVRWVSARPARLDALGRLRLTRTVAALATLLDISPLPQASTG